MTPPKRLPQQPTPKVVDTYANVWGLPDRYRGASLVSLDARKSAWLTDAVRAWILSAVNGSAFRPGNLVSAAGLTAVGEEYSSDEFFTAVLTDIFRQPECVEYRREVGSNWMRWASGEEVHQSIREDRSKAKDWANFPLLVISPVTQDKWAAASIASLMELRKKNSFPTMLTMAPSDARALMVDGVNAHLRSIVKYLNDEVVL